MSRSPMPVPDDQATAAALRHALASLSGNLDRRTWADLAAGGWLQLLVESGGPTAGQLAELLATMEEWGAALVPGPAVLTVAFTLPLLTGEPGGSLADAIAAGRVVTATREATGALPEAGIKAVQDGVTWRLSGHARLVPWLPDADEVIVTAHDSNGASLVASVATVAADAEITPGETVDPGISVGDLVLNDAPASLVFAADQAQLSAAAASYSLALDAQAIGAAAELIRRATAYVIDRRQFGQPVGSFQAVKHRIADMITATEAARSLLWQAATRFADRPLEPPWEDIDASRVCAGDAARRVAAAAIQCFGGMGFTWEQGVHLFYRRALVAGSLLGNVDAAATRLVEAGMRHRRETP